MAMPFNAQPGASETYLLPVVTPEAAEAICIEAAVYEGQMEADANARLQAHNPLFVSFLLLVMDRAGLERGTAEHTRTGEIVLAAHELLLKAAQMKLHGESPSQGL